MKYAYNIPFDLDTLGDKIIQEGLRAAARHTSSGSASKRTHKTIH